MLRLFRPRTLIRLAHEHGPTGKLTALLTALLVGVAASALQATGIASSPLAALDDAAHDLLLRSQPPDTILGSLGINQAADPRSFITIVAIDERTIAELGAYNGGYPRSYHAQVVENLLAAPPRVIAFDFGFFEPTPDDAVLAAAFKHAHSLPVPTTIILGTVGLAAQGQADSRTPSGELVFDGSLVPVPILAENVSLALANIVPDERGTIRSMPLVAYVRGVERPTLGLAATASYLRRHVAYDARSASSLEVAGRSIPLESDASVRINYFGPPSQPYSPDATFRVISFVDVLRGRVDPGAWSGRLVLIGALGATGLADDYWTPMSDQGRKMAGVEIHANVAATLFSTRFLAEAPLPLDILIILSLAVLMALCATNLGGPAAWFAPCLALCAYVAGDAWALYARGLLLPLSTPMLAGLVSLSAAAAQRVASEQRFARRLRADVAYGASHDILTGLPNRAWFQLRLGEAIVAARQLTLPCALLLVDLDRFKEINETLGHQAGDALLCEVGRRLTGVLPAHGMVARHGADAFVLLLSGSDAAAAVHVAAQVTEVLTPPILLDEQEVLVGASIGVAAYPEHGLDPDTLLRRAELAMYAAKHTRGSHAIYSADQDRQSSERLALVGTLRKAIEGDQLVLYYQPKIDCRSGQLVGVEALARWQHPQLGLVQPDRFIGLAEETGLIAQLTRWALSEALRQARAWLDVGLEIPIAVNLSAFDVQEAQMPTVIADLLGRWNVPARLLTVEITEGALLADPALALDVLQQLERLGVVAALDDFGSGYSSLGYLKQFPVHELKIDRSLVSDIAHQPRDQTIVRSTVELGHSLGLIVVAEGVEDAPTLAMLKTLGCDLAQGYFIARPMPAASLMEWVHDLDDSLDRPAAA
jgi:diguanylate cyclase (GGDEF)-like protein